MNKTLKVVAIIMLLIIGMTVMSNLCYAVDTGYIDTVETEAKKDDPKIKSASYNIAGMAGKVIRLIRNVAVIAAVLLVSVLGIKYMMGSAEEKADYKKSFIPLIVGAIVIVMASQIAAMIFSIGG